jgi:hypothetical protein
MIGSMPIRRVISRAGDVLANRLEAAVDRSARSRLGALGRLIRNATEAWNRTGSSMVEGVPPLNVPPPARPTDVSDDADPVV